MIVERDSSAGKWKDGKSTMKQESEEKTIKELFQRLKQEDERRAPSFADSLAAARSHLETKSVRARASNWPRWALAAVTAILIPFGFIVYRSIQNRPQKPNGVITEKAPEPKPSVELKGLIVKEDPGPRHESRAPRPKRHNRPRLNVPLITYSMPVYEKKGEYATDFIPLSYGGIQKPMESGEVISMEIPRPPLIRL